MDQHIVQAVSIRWYNACAYYAVALARGLEKIGIRSSVAGRYATPALKKASAYGLGIVDTPGSGEGGVTSYLGRIRAYRRFALDEGVTLVNAHNGTDHLLWALALRGTGIPLIRTSGNQVVPNVHTGSRFLLEKTRGVITSCRTIQGYYADGFGIPRADIPIINGGVDSEYFSAEQAATPARDDFGIPDDAFVFGMFARYSPDKGHEYFFRAAESVAKDIPRAWFLVAGWDAQLNEDDIRAMAREAGVLDRTVFTGRHGDTRDLIGLIDAGVIASVNSETICRIAMEYMAMGRPVVSTDTNVIPEVVRDGRTGIVVPARDSDAMARAMTAMASDRGNAVEMGREGERVIRDEYSLEAFARKTLMTYGALTGS